MVMDKSSREAKIDWRAQQRALERSAFPLPDEQLRLLFDHIDEPIALHLAITRYA